MSKCKDAPMTTPQAKPEIPILGDKTNTPNIIPNEYIDGAKAGKRKLWWVLRIPIINPETPKIAAEGKIIRNR